MTNLNFQCILAVPLTTLATIFLFSFFSLIAVILSMCRHLYYCWHGTLCDATILETFPIMEWKKKFERDEDRTIGGTLIESMFDFRSPFLCGRQCALVEYEATVVDVLGNEKETTTSYRTIRLQKWLSIPRTVVCSCGDPSLPVSLPVMVLPARPKSAILHEQQFPQMLLFILWWLVGLSLSPLYLLKWYHNVVVREYIMSMLKGCYSWHLGLAYVIATVAGTLFLRICVMMEPSAVIVGGQEMKDISNVAHEF
jgi:hypothetical protein